MAALTDEKIDQVVNKLNELYETSFRGKKRGRYGLTRDQMRQALDVDKLHDTAIEKLQDAALRTGLVIIDLDGFFPIVEVDVIRKYRKPPVSIFQAIFAISAEVDDEEYVDEDDRDLGDEEE